MRFKFIQIKSNIINIVLYSFIFWYFIFHVGLGSYYKKYFTPEEVALNSNYYKSRVYTYVELNSLLDPNLKHVVITGDSLVEKFPINELQLYEPISCGPIINRGIGMDTTVGLLSRLGDNISSINISKIFILIGHNDIKYRKPEKTIENIRKILKNVVADKKYIISVLPSADEKTNNQTIELNFKLNELCNAIDVTYLDFFKFLSDENGHTNDDYYYDETHLNIEGYVLIYKMLYPFF